MKLVAKHDAIQRPPMPSCEQAPQRALARLRGAAQAPPAAGVYV